MVVWWADILYLKRYSCRQGRSHGYWIGTANILMNMCAWRQASCSSDLRRIRTQELIAWRQTHLQGGLTFKLLNPVHGRYTVNSHNTKSHNTCNWKRFRNNIKIPIFEATSTCIHPGITKLLCTRTVSLFNIQDTFCTFFIQHFILEGKPALVSLDFIFVIFKCFVL